MILLVHKLLQPILALFQVVWSIMIFASRLSMAPITASKVDFVNSLLLTL
jgi:hypothetical protein